MATKYLIKKHRVFFQNFNICISTNNKDISKKFLPDTNAHINIIQNAMTLKGQNSRSHQGYLV